MKQLSQKDQILLESIVHNNGKKYIASIIFPGLKMLGSNKVSNVLAHENFDIHEIIFDYLCKLESYQTFLKGIHWMSKHKSTHELANNIREQILIFQDEIAEDAMGLLGIRIYPEQITNTADLSFVTLKDLLISLRTDTISISNKIGKNAECRGLINVFDEIIHFVNKALYLATLQ